MVGNVSSYLSADPGVVTSDHNNNNNNNKVVTYLEGPLHTQQPPHWAVRSAAAIALLFKVSKSFLKTTECIVLLFGIGRFIGFDILVLVEEQFLANIGLNFRPTCGFLSLAFILLDMIRDQTNR